MSVFTISIQSQIFIIPAIFGIRNLLLVSDTTEKFWTALLYGLALILLFSISTIYHSVCLAGFTGSTRFTFHMFDRACIYYFITASYLPWLNLTDLDSRLDWIRYSIWILAIVGIYYQYMFHEKYKMVELSLYRKFGRCF